MNSRVCVSCGTLFDGFNVTCNICIASEQQRKTSNRNSRLQRESNERIERERLDFERQQAYHNRMMEIAQLRIIQQQQDEFQLPQTNLRKKPKINPKPIDNRTPMQKMQDQAIEDQRRRELDEQFREQERQQKFHERLKLTTWIMVGSVAAFLFWEFILRDYWIWVLGFIGLMLASKTDD